MRGISAVGMGKRLPARVVDLPWKSWHNAHKRTIGRNRLTNSSFCSYFTRSSIE